MVCTCAATAGRAATLYGAIIRGSISSAYPAMPSAISRSAVSRRYRRPSPVSGCGAVSARTSARIRSPNCRWHSMTICPPMDRPPSTMSSSPRWSSRAARSPANVSRGVIPGTTVLRPYPRRSAATTRQPDRANSATCGAHIERSNGWPCTRTSGGPSPSSSYPTVIALTVAVPMEVSLEPAAAREKIQFRDRGLRARVPIDSDGSRGSAMSRRVVLLSAAVVAATVIPAGPAQAAPDPTEARIRSTMAAMTLPEKVGQMFASYIYGDTATTGAPADVAANQALYGADVHDGADLLARYHLGGIIYFTWTGNLAEPQQIGALSNGLQRASRVPLLISTDQEGGVVNRIGAPVAVSPGNMALGATFNPLDAFRAARVSGTELRAMGINVDDAPVVDVNTNPRNSADGPRAFGDRTAVVSAFAAAAVARDPAGGVASPAKHLPRLGGTTVNTDNGVAVTNETRQQILDTDVPPFRAAQAAGTKSVMVAHIVAPALDPSGRPAS